MKHVTQLRELTTEELREKEAEVRENLFRLRFKKNLGDVEAARKVAGERKQLARVQTLLRARTLGVETV
jgi:large subunit ribosomal protein L29